MSDFDLNIPVLHQSVVFSTVRVLLFSQDSGQFKVRCLFKLLGQLDNPFGCLMTAEQSGDEAQHLYLPFSEAMGIPAPLVRHGQSALPGRDYPLIQNPHAKLGGNWESFSQQDQRLIPGYAELRRGMRYAFRGEYQVIEREVEARCDKAISESLLRH